MNWLRKLFGKKSVKAKEYSTEIVYGYDTEIKFKTTLTGEGTYSVLEDECRYFAHTSRARVSDAPFEPNVVNGGFAVEYTVDEYTSETNHEMTASITDLSSGRCLVCHSLSKITSQFQFAQKKVAFSITRFDGRIVSSKRIE